jgi:predicted AlkP superfamily pyrophosphatase or phosphodiesterase
VWLFVLIAAASACARTAQDPILILISFDGWRWDYIDRASVPNLRALAARGVRAEGLIPSFPSNTFPNHYTLVTGLLPDHHGIVDNTFNDPMFPERFSLSSETSRDPKWWGAEPLWATATQHGKRSASMFWPGSDVAIGGVRPDYWKPYDGKLPNAARVKQVLEWLALPPQERPSFITLYFSEVDTAGHDYGPESQEVLDAAAHLDAALGELLSGIESSGLLTRTTVVVVSDHGMSQLSRDRRILLDDYLNPSAVDISEWSGAVKVAPGAEPVDQIYQALKGKHPALAIYKREELPADLQYGKNPRVSPIIGLADDGWTVTTKERLERDREQGRKSAGAHGFDPKYRSMHGLFVAAGPRVKPGLVVAPFHNIDVYDFLCTLLELLPEQNDGDPRTTQAFLNK